MKRNGLKYLLFSKNVFSCLLELLTLFFLFWEDLCGFIQPPGFILSTFLCHSSETHPAVGGGGDGGVWRWQARRNSWASLPVVPLGPWSFRFVEVCVCSVAVSRSGHLLQTFIPALVNYFQCTGRRSGQQSSLSLSCSSYSFCCWTGL